MVVDVGIALIIATAIIAGALTTFFSTATSTWSGSVVAVWGLVALLAVLSIGLAFYKQASKGTGGL